MKNLDILAFFVWIFSAFSSIDGSIIIEKSAILPPLPIPMPLPPPTGLIPRFDFPFLPGLKFDPLSVKNIADFVPGWGAFNLGADVHKIIFTLQNQKGNYAEHILKPEDLRTFEIANWDPMQNTIIVIHGYTEDGTNSPLSATKKIISAYVQVKRQENLIFVDWHALSRQLIYFRSANNTEKDVHIVGFSLGAHCAGIAGHYAGRFLKETVGRITGLDPAGPGFKNAALESRLSQGDATFVDVIHTNKGDILTTFGTTHVSGDIDFYPNGGEHQPGCTLKLVGEVVGVCSHLKAPEYFVNTILKAKDYIAYKCNDYDTFLREMCPREDPVHMGEYVDPSARGEYYLSIPLE